MKLDEIPDIKVTLDQPKACAACGGYHRHPEPTVTVLFEQGVPEPLMKHLGNFIRATVEGQKATQAVVARAEAMARGVMMDMVMRGELMRDFGDGWCYVQQSQRPERKR